MGVGGEKKKTELREGRKSQRDDQGEKGCGTTGGKRKARLHVGSEGEERESGDYKGKV